MFRKIRVALDSSTLAEDALGLAFGPAQKIRQ